MSYDTHNSRLTTGEYFPSKSFRGLELCVKLTDEPIAGSADAGNLRIEICRRFGGGDFLQRFSLTHERRNLVTDCDDHVAMCYERGAVDGRTVAGNYFGIRPTERDGLCEPIEHSLKCAAVGAIDVRIAQGSEVIASHQDIILSEANERVAVGVRGTDRNRFHILAIEMKRDLLIVSHDGKRGRGSRSSRSAVRTGTGIREPVAQLIARKDCLK